MIESPYLLAIESSCDDTAAAVLHGKNVLSNCVANQKIHQQYGGVVPELASRAHQSNIVPVIQQALQQANIDKKQIAAIAYTQGPGLLGSLLVGGSFAKSLALAWGIPLLEIDHMQGHLLVHFIEDVHPKPPSFPFIGVTLSGGHTQIVWVEDYFKMTILGSTLDDAIGEAFDKCGKLMGLPYPAGPYVDRLAQEGDPTRFAFPKPKVAELDVSYSGIKTAFMNFINRETQKNSAFVEENRSDLCASLQHALVEIILDKLTQAVATQKNKQITTLDPIEVTPGDDRWLASSVSAKTTVQWPTNRWRTCWPNWRTNWAKVSVSNSIIMSSGIPSMPNGSRRQASRSRRWVRLPESWSSCPRLRRRSRRAHWWAWWSSWRS
ncbi:MAG: tRNA (adenosine(37)-N6)-threonylcarbamoyltransferase complex transferase subunit TsaD, partial [Flavobacteriaceae bacterium]